MAIITSLISRAVSHETTSPEQRKQKQHKLTLQPPPRDPTLQHPNCVYQILRRHYAAYTPEMVERVAALPVEGFVIDGELVIDLGDHFYFEALQLRLHPAESRVRKLAAATPARIILFDMLVAPDGAVLVDEPLSKRRKALERLVAKLKRPELSLSPGTRDRCEALAWLSRAGSVLGIQATEVTPPARAEAVPVAMVSSSSRPGSRRWTCMSIKPGQTILPAASMVRSA